MDRVRALEEIVLESIGRGSGLISTESVLVVNDGVARSHDIEDSGPAIVTAIRGPGCWTWLQRVLETHAVFNSREAVRGLPGLRSVLTYGERAMYSRGNRTFGSLWRQWKNADPDRISDEELKRISVYLPLEFQMNLAFAKAYYLESLGGRAGLKGQGFFADEPAVQFMKDSGQGVVELVRGGGQHS